MEIINRRNTLVRTAAAIKGGKLKIGFIGGSITSFGNYRSYCEYITSALMQDHPNVRISTVNAGIGGTGSDYGVFRVERDVISKNCDLVFVEFAVNDDASDANYRAKTREGLIRKLIKAGCDVVAVYTYCSSMYAPMMKDEIPPSIADFEKICEHYGVGSVWMSRYALDQVKNGLLRLDEWLPDGLHPQERGGSVYACPVTEYLRTELSEAAASSNAALPAPIKEDNFENCRIIPFDEISFAKPWQLRDNYQANIRNEYLDTCAVGARLKYEFNGTGTALLYMFGTKTCDLFYSIDGSEFLPVPGINKAEGWMGENNWYKFAILAEGLASGTHTCELETRASALGSRCAIEMIGEIG